MSNYVDHTHDASNRTVSIGLSWTRKVLSSVRVYGEQRDLPFFLYEKYLAMKYFNAQTRAKTMGLTGRRTGTRQPGVSWVLGDRPRRPSRPRAHHGTQVLR